jgi:hypothetical protein
MYWSSLVNGSLISVGLQSHVVEDFPNADDVFSSSTKINVSFAVV